MRRLVAEERQALVTMLQGVGKERLEREPVLGTWSCRDILGHCLVWDEEAARNLDLVLSGRTPEIVRPYGEEGLDAWNERAVEGRRSIPYDRLLQSFTSLGSTLDRQLQRVTAGQLQVRTGDGDVAALVAVDTYEHYREHRKHVEDWLSANR